MLQLEEERSGKELIFWDGDDDGDVEIQIKTDGDAFASYAYIENKDIPDVIAHLENALKC